MSNIQRHRLERNGAYLAEDHDGEWVLHSDHAAVVGKITDQLESLRTTLCSSLAAHADHAAELAEWKQRAISAEASLAARIQNNKGSELVLETARDAWRTRAERAEAYVAGQDLRSDFRNAGEMRAALDAALADVSMRSREVYRESQLRRKIEEMMKEHAEYLRENRMLDDQARAATDAAGILKGAGT